MAGYGWRKDLALIEQIFAESYRFDFFQAVRLLQVITPRANGLGEGVQAEQEAVRLRSSLSADFAASEIETIRPADRPGVPPEMTVNFMGLAGAFGPLPRPLSERILDRVRRHDTAGRDFLDIFNHRLISLFFRIRQRHRAALSRGGPQHSNFARHLAALIGLGTKGLQGRLDGLPDRALLHCAGLLAVTPRSLHATERVVAAHFGVRVAGEAMIGRWVPLGPDQETRLGAGGRNSRLGSGFVLGSRYWDQNAAIRLNLGPLDLATFRQFLPIGDASPPLRSLVGLLAGYNTDCEVRLLLAAAEVPRLRLLTADGVRLGWTSWLVTQPPREDRAVVLLPSLDPGLQIEELIGSFEMFAGLERDALKALARLFRPRLLVPDEVIIREGERGRGMFFISSGAVEVVLPNERVRLGSGEFFGEMALLSGRPRGVDVVSLGYGRALELSAADFHEFLSIYPRAKAEIERIAEIRTRSGERRG